MRPQPITIEVRGELTDDHAKAALLILEKIWDRVGREQGKRLVVANGEGKSGKARQASHRSSHAVDDR
ncbi:hypothetical protein NZD89_08005 [Alicyclobacillus fastidiosus]|uniref:Uncharacterized protein n=1 Tax=Alicyclobacillus fastidiosus TaxID=392011 RepID=A0ABY6ZL58_9BACL|nr:hypothetical protein [Alicyclobacillus fastidiosus]WAH43323.1 hypothetical protein NZD89_08005 [Alicyclobacillus fastidiosus]GMA65378.1 hypothetical protein GCM10025859_58180 [Alicyclobacillus fastidiosus]